MVSEVSGAVSESLFAGGGEMGALMRSLDWSQTPIGSAETWSQSLRTSLSICLNSRFPILIWWGPELVMLYNDAYRPILGKKKHPNAMGQRGQECWAEVWHVIGPMLNDVMTMGNATWSNDQLLLLDRNGYLEECYFTFSYSPILDETGGVGGVFTAVTETTTKVIGERRLQTLRELSTKTIPAKTVKEACSHVLETLAQNRHDIPFALLYGVEDNGKRARLAGTAGIEAGTIASPEQVDLIRGTDAWHLAQVKTTSQAQLINDLNARFGLLFGSTWDDSPNTALVMPLAQSGQAQQLAGLLILGISPRREFDDEYRGFFDLVASNVATAIANADAYEAERKRAEALAELDRAKTTFFSNVSHEFRTPLTLMLSPLEDTLANANGELPLRQRESLELVHRNGLRLLKLVNTLLDFARIEAGRVQAVYEPTDLATFTTELVSVFRAAIERAGMRLIANCPPLPEPVYVDRQMWEKVVFNLLSNAFKFTFEGEITVSLRWEETHIELVVQDTGIGIPVEEIPHLFERFHRVPGAQGRTGEGSGIGLSLVQELVKLHGGTIFVTSVVDRGSCFVVSIPTGTAHLPSDRINATRTLTSTATGASPYVEEALRWLPEARDGGAGGDREDGEVLLSFSSSTSPASLAPPAPSAHILLADDNADMRDYVKRLLSQQYEVEAVADGVAALAAIRIHMPDLVLTDVMMPRLDGFELLKQLRADPSTQEIPVILLSARAGEESRVEGLEAGADDYLIKPFSARELLARVEANLKMARLRQEAIGREQALRIEAQAAQEQLARVLAGIDDQFLVLDREWRYTYVSDRVSCVVGIPKEGLLGKSIWEVFPDTVGTQLYTEVHRAVAEQTRVQFEYFYPRLQRWFENHVYPFAEGVSIFVADISDRKQAEKALQESEERARLAFKVGRLGTWRYESGTDLVELDERMREIWSVPNDAVTIPFPMVMERIHPDDQARVANGVSAALDPRSSGTYEIDYRIVCDGTERWVLANGQAQFEGEGLARRSIGFIGTALDMTDRKRIEATLRHSEQRYRSLIEATSQIIWDTRAEGEFVTEQPAWSAFTGQTFDELKGWGWLKAVHPDDRANTTQVWSAALALSTLYEVEHRLRRHDGTYRHMSVRAVPVFEEDGTIREWIGIHTDVTDRKQVEAALQEAHVQLESALVAGAVYTWRWKIPDDRVIVNAAFAHLFAVDPVGAATEGLPIEMFVRAMHEEDRPRIVAAINRAIETGEEYAAEYRVHTATGEERWLTARGRVEYDAAGNPVSLPGALIDITDRKLAEAEREQLLVREQAAREQAETANRIKDEFLAVLSHELRSPLNPILGWSKLLQGRKLDEKRTAYALETIERNAKLQVQLIDDLLDVARILRGKLSLNVAPVNLATTITAALETVRLAAEAKSIQIQMVLEPDVGRVLGDSGRLQQVIWNLMSNAVKFTPQGGRVELRLEQVDTHAQITVSDTGKGIHPDFLPHVFEYFRQADSATTRQFGGLGLGLAIVRQIVELHGGTVQAASPGVGQGAIFTVRYPLMQHQSAIPQQVRESKPPSGLQGIKVLVVEDTTDMREYVTFVLEQEGAKVVAVPSAAQALTALAQFQPEVLVSDIGMPEMDGYMLLRQVRMRSPQQGGQIPAIALTAYVGEINQQQAIAAGFQRHLAKPVEPEALVKVIADLTQRAK